MDFQALMEQAQKMSEEAENIKKELEEKEYTGTAGGDGVVIKMNGSYNVVSVDIKGDLLSADNKEMLQDLVSVAVNDVCKKIESEKLEKMSSLAGGADLSGLM